MSDEKTGYLYYSAKADEMLGHHIGRLDETGEEVHYTYLTYDPDAKVPGDNYSWPDAKPLGPGKWVRRGTKGRFSDFVQGYS